jgi:hypothetical protein
VDELSYDDVNWMSRYLQIITMSGDLAPLTLNLAQMKVHNTLELQRRANVPMRAIVLKARREGVSTYVSGRFFKETLQRARRGASICSADLDATDKVFKMIRHMKDHLPGPLQRKTNYSNRKEIEWAEPHLGGLIAQTAGKEVLGRGGLCHYLHCSEFAFWSNASKQLLGVMQEVPNDPGTMVILESTANGVGGAFHEMFEQAMADWESNQDLRNWLPIFLPWYIFPKYQLPMECAFEIGRPHAEGFDQAWCEPEEELVNVFGCVPEQLMWRRHQIKVYCQGDLAMFRQEYPATPDEAFQTTGSPVFNMERLNHQERIAQKGGTYGLFDEDGFHEVAQTFNTWKMLIPPQPGHEYTMGADTMEGRPADPQDVRSKLDFHGVSVFDRTTGEYCCIYEGSGSQYELAHQVFSCHKWYHNAIVAPEIPNGMELLGVLKQLGCEELFETQKGEDTWEPEATESLGWRTTLVTRVWLVEGFKTALFTNAIRLNFPEIIRQARSFIKNKTGKPIHAPGKHDDLLFGAMIALQVHLRTSMKPGMYGYGTVSDCDSVRLKRGSQGDLAYSGAIDHGPDAEGDNEFYVTW